eukprot:5311646-Prymnesium_polylepis.1
MDLEAAPSAALLPKPHGDHSRGSSSFHAGLINQFKSVFGTGLLAMPYAMLTVGVPCGVLLTVLIGAWAIYTMQLLAWCTIMVDRYRGSATPYSELVTMAFGGVVGQLSTANLVLHQIACCSAYLVFIGDNLQQPLGLSDPSVAMAALTVPFVLLCWLSDLRRLMA